MISDFFITCIFLNYLHKLNNKAVQLEHNSSLLKMQNAVIGERLKGLYSAIMQTSGNLGVQKKLQEEFELSCSSVKSLGLEYEALKAKYQEVTQSRDQIVQDSYEVISMKDTLEDQRDRIQRVFKEKVNQMQTQIQNLLNEREELKEKVTSLENSVKQLSSDNLYIKNQLKKYKSSHSNQTERQCTLCNLYYYENENFNWSCKTHKSRYIESAGYYFCCGKKGESAPGCIKSKHVSGEQEEAKDSEKSINETCTNCKSIGHSSHNCPKDPNVHDEFDPAEELDRINMNSKLRRKSLLNTSEIRDKLAQVMGDKPISIDTLETEGAEERTSNGFKDLELVKQEIHHKDTLITSLDPKLTLNN